MITITYLVAVAKSIYDIYRGFKKDKIKTLIEYSKIKNISEDIQLLVKENIEIEIFKSITGVYAEEAFRKKLIELHKDAKGAINWNHIERAFPYLHLSDEVYIEVAIGLYGIINFILNIVVFIGFIILGNYIVGVYSKDINHTISLSDFLLKALSGGLMYMVSGLYLTKTFAVIDAYKIKKYLDESSLSATPPTSTACQ